MGTHPTPGTSSPAVIRAVRLRSQGSEEPPNQTLAAPRSDYRQMGDERNGCVREFLALLAPAAHCGREHPSHGYAQERIRGIRTIINVLFKLATFARRTTTSHEGYGIDLNEQSDGTPPCRRLEVEHMPMPKDSSSVWRAGSRDRSPVGREMVKSMPVEYRFWLNGPVVTQRFCLTFASRFDRLR
jgi:hypothetical protein